MLFIKLFWELRIFKKTDFGDNLQKNTAYSESSVFPEDRSIPLKFLFFLRFSIVIIVIKNSRSKQPRHNNGIFYNCKDKVFVARVNNIRGLYTLRLCQWVLVFFFYFFDKIFNKIDFLKKLRDFNLEMFFFQIFDIAC